MSHDPSHLTTAITRETGLQCNAFHPEGRTDVLTVTLYAGEDHDIPVARLTCNWTTGVWYPRQDSRCTSELVVLVLSLQGLE